MSRSALLVPAALAVCLLGACNDAPQTAEAARPVRVLRVGAQADAVGATYSGEISARRDAALGFLVGGRIQQRLVEVGDTVAAGTPLFRLDPTDATLNANASRSQVASARSQYEQAKADYARYSQLAGAQYVSRSELDKARMSLQTAQEALRAAQASYGVVANQATYTTLRATTAGVVTSLEAEAGQVVSAGQVVVRIAERGERELVVSVPESRVDELRNARALTVDLWADPRHRYTGRLRELAPDADAVTRTYTAKISVLGADDALRLGMTAKLHVALPVNGTLRRVPLTAIYDPRGKPHVWIVDEKTSRVRLQPVDLAQAQNDGVLVRSGLRDGQVVVTAGVNLLHAGQKVQL
ncbi:multidrug transporter [Lysobacter helvus]|uniref:Multidrug transporter n=2 Tax=Lysobacteraceae TaxID=32033 RepID=A0ABN6FP13_9GAMM|nr:MULTISPECIES: efflux RND transporter periplasmic adaptor subunit [Lysobacter]BCT91316.1 multidrug transporter [Lysobacter caseinilyticus]BCT94469.1 multidrug transporter [Lysobacter helvus]